MKFDFEKYSEFIVKEDEYKILLHCIMPGHNDVRRSAVFYKDSGRYFCPSCGSYRFKTSGLQSRKSVITETPLFFDIGKYPLHYYKTDTMLVVANVIDNVVKGVTHRISVEGGRYYMVKGLSGFRLNAKVITESTTDAICLIENGIDAGSICSKVNHRLVKSHQIYFPQLDKVGREIGLDIQKYNKAVTYWWNSKYKDICDVPENERGSILSVLKEVAPLQFQQSPICP